MRDGIRGNRRFVVKEFDICSCVFQANCREIIAEIHSCRKTPHYQLHSSNSLQKSPEMQPGKRKYCNRSKTAASDLVKG